jgi:ketosteroid isomerase-like protein
LSDANTGLVRRLYDAFNREEFDFIVDMVAADCRWEVVSRSSDFPALGPRYGREGVRAFFDALAQHLAFREFNPKEFYAIDDKVIVLGSYAMTVRRTGRPFAGDWIHVFTFAGGLIKDFREFTDTARAADAYRN